MERFRFGEQEGPNGKTATFNGWLAVFSSGAHGGGEAKHCTLEVAGPNGGVRAQVVMDKATAGVLGAALLKWADGEVMPVLDRMIKEGVTG